MSATYGTVYVRADEIQPRTHKLDDGSVVIHLVDPPVSIAVVGTTDQIIAACTRVATAASDAEEPRLVFDDIPPHPGGAA